MSLHQLKPSQEGQPSKPHLLSSGLEAPASAPNQELRLKKRLGLWSGSSIIIGCMIGSGIFVSPKGVLADSGSIGASLSVWALCGVLTLAGSLCFAELGTSVQSSGGDYTYIRLAYGPLAGFLFLWAFALIIMPCSNAIAALTFANYILQPLYPDGCSPDPSAIRLLALAMLMGLVYLNCANVNGSIKLQNSFTVAKVAALVLVVIYGLYYVMAGRSVSFNDAPSKDKPTHQAGIWDGTSQSAAHLAQAFYSAFYTYAGWNSLNCVTEEMENPVRNLPRALVLSISAITLIYVATNFAYFAVLTPSQILASDAIAALFGQQALGKLAGSIMPLAVAASTIGGLNGGIFAGSRILFTGARQGHLFSALELVHMEEASPVLSIIFLGLVSAIYLSTTRIYQLINYMIFVEASFAALAVSTVLVLRRKLPNLERPLKIPYLIPVFYLAFCSLLIILPISTSPLEAAIGLSITLAGIPIYYATIHRKVRPASYLKLLNRFNSLIQKLTLCATPDKDVMTL